MYTWLKKIVIAIVGLLVLAVFLSYITGNQYLIKAARLTYLKGFTTANINDYKYFDTRVIENGTPQYWKYSKDFNKIPLTETLKNELIRLESAGFLIVKNGEIFSETYFDDYNEESLTNSFSMAKTFVTMMLGKAIEQGYIQGINQPMVDFLPEYKNDSLAKMCTIGDLSAMTAGYDWEENYYLPFNVTTKAYYGENINDQILSYGFNSASGEKFQYKSGTTHLLGIILARATGKNLSEYFSENFWEPMGMEADALWTIDQKDGVEKSYCCVSSRLRDFAKIGQLFLQHGNWNGKQLLDSNFVQLMITPNTMNGKIKNPNYGYGMWEDDVNDPKFYAIVGHLGQRIICVPSAHVVIVRTGNLTDKKNNSKKIPGKETYIWLEEALKMLGD